MFYTGARDVAPTVTDSTLHVSPRVCLCPAETRRADDHDDMTALQPPVRLVLASSARAVPVSASGRVWALEPKFDGWRSALFTAAGVLQSRRDNDLAARFPEIIDAASSLGDVVLDGEIVALREGRLDFGALTSSPRVRASSGIAIYFIAFDLLADAERDMRREPYRLRRERLQNLLQRVRPPLQLAPSTTDRGSALAWMDREASGVGIEGVVAKRVDAPYRPGRGGDWVKVRSMSVVDAIVVGVTGDARKPVEVVLARRDGTGELRQIGLSLPLTPALQTDVGARVTAADSPPQTVSTGVFGRPRTRYQPVAPELVVEVEAEASVASFTHRLRPRVHRLRLDLHADDQDAAI